MAFLLQMRYYGAAFEYRKVTNIVLAARNAMFGASNLQGFQNLGGFFQGKNILLRKSKLNYSAAISLLRHILRCLQVSSKGINQHRAEAFILLAIG